MRQDSLYPITRQVLQFLLRGGPAQQDIIKGRKVALESFIEPTHLTEDQGRCC